MLTDSLENGLDAFGDEDLRDREDRSLRNLTSRT
jgi:hypothetical protein